MNRHMNLQIGQDGDSTLRFRIRNSPVANLWVERMKSRDNHPLDHPTRFYGFNTFDEEKQRAVKQIQGCIDVINAYEHIIHRPFTFDQDGLNYLHNIFEHYHGLLDQQDTDFWLKAPLEVRRALAELNLDVHRCESVMTNNHPKLVCTWFGLPKIHCLDPVLQSEYGSMQVTFGTVYLNYCEIGKTVEDLANDNDEYIADEAFKPFSHYSADFRISFYDQDLNKKIPAMEQYFRENRDFFIARNIESVYDVRALPLRFPVADLDDKRSREEIISLIRQNQHVKQVTID